MPISSDRSIELPVNGNYTWWIFPVQVGLIASTVVYGEDIERSSPPCIRYLPTPEQLTVLKLELTMPKKFKTITGLNVTAPLFCKHKIKKTNKWDFMLFC